MFSFKKIILLVGGFIAFSTVVLVYAETQTFTVGIRFIAPLSFANKINPDFGRFEAGASGRHFILGTDGTISGIDAAAYVDGANAGSLEIHGSAFQKIDIIAQNIVDNGGISVTNILCNYGGAGDTDCGTGISAAAAPTIPGTALLIGLDINTTTSHADGDSAAPAFDIVVTYN